MPIIKDGKLATSCGCCGGWYCCPPAECALDVVNSVVVTITPVSSEWIRNLRSNSSCYSENSKSYDYRTLAVPASSVSGSHSLQKISETTWAKTIGVDSVGCLSPVISVTLHSYSVSSGVLRLEVASPAYYWYKKTESDAVGFKPLSEMQCDSTPPWDGPISEYCSGYAEGFEEYNRQLVLTSSFVSFECGVVGTESFNHILGFIQPSTGFIDNLQNPQLIEETFGSLLCNVSVAFG